MKAKYLTKRPRNSSMRATARQHSVAFEWLESRRLMASDLAPSSANSQDLTFESDVVIAPKIINGTIANAYPAVAKMGYRLGSGSEFIGSGVLIAPQYVLTAAHVAIEVPTGQGRVQFGSTTYNASEIFVHPGYDENALGGDSANDIAIYKLDAPITSITPNAIARSTPTVGSSMTLVGYGGTGNGQSGSDGSFGTLRAGTTTLERVTGTVLHWTFDVGSTESNSAPGDSGGPSYIDVNGQKVVAGITSGGLLTNAGWGDESFNTRVDAYQTWIDDILNANEATGLINYSSSGATYAQDFDTLVSTGTSSLLPTGWFLAESGANANTTYGAGNGSNTTGNTYSFGVTGTAEQSFGTLQSSSLNPLIGAGFTNTTGVNLTSIAISYTGEQWRLGTAGRADRLDFQYSLDATSLSNGTWVDVNALDFSSLITAGTAGALNGNAAANRRAVAATIGSLNVPHNGTIWIRWTDFNATGADDGLAIDDFRFTVNATVANTAPTISSISDQNTPFQTAITAIPFTVADQETAAASLVVTAGSSNTNLIPVAGITFGGSGANRTVSIQPAAGQSGTSTITLTVSDGTLVSSISFSVYVVAGITETVNLRFVTYNLAAAGSQGVRNGLSTVLAGIGNEIVNGISRPIDLLAIQEVASQATTSTIVAGVLNSLYATSVYQSGVLDGLQLASNGVQFGMTQGVVYNSSTLQLISEVALGTPSTSGIARQVMRYLFRPIGTTGSTDFYLYNSHYKAVDDSEGRQRRLVEAQLIRNDADALGDGKNIIYAGDFNTYSSSEAGYQRLLSAGAGQAFDPLNRPGAWSGSTSFRNIFTQSPALNPANNLGLVGGGLDDRFDFQLVTDELLDGVGIDIVSTSYRSFAINGSLPLNTAINDSRNTALPGLPNRTAVLNAMAVVSDHIPVVADYQFSRAVPNATPTSILLSNSSVVENVAGGATVGSLTTVDPNPDDTFVYTLVSGTGSEDNSKFSIVGNTIRTTAAFDFESQTELSIRIRATDQGGLSTDRVFVIDVLDLPEVVGSVTIGNGSVQRSLVNQLVVTFDGPIDISAGAFSVSQRGGGVVTTNATAVIDATGQTNVTLTFAGSLTHGPFAALNDGYYQLSIDGTKITRSGRLLDADKNGVGGDGLVFGAQESDKFFALFGDSTGDGLVGLTEFGQFRQTYSKRVGEPEYNALFDYDGVAVSISDFGKFRERYAKPKLPWIA